MASRPGESLGTISKIWGRVNKSLKIFVTRKNRTGRRREGARKRFIRINKYIYYTVQ